MLSSDGAVPAPGARTAAPAAAAPVAPPSARARPASSAASRRPADAATLAPPAGPRPEFAWAAAVFALCTLLLGYPALGGRFLALPQSDQYLAGYAFREFTGTYMRAHGGPPLWNPYLMGGVPHVAGMAGDIFYPPSLLLRALLPTDRAMTWGLVLHVFAAGCFTFLFLRRAVGVGFHGALVGGVAYLMGGNVAGLVSPGHDGKLFVAALLPLALFYTHRVVRDGRLWAVGALALTITFAVLSPHPQLLQYLLLVCGAYAVFAALGRPDDRATAPSRGAAVARLGLAALAVGAGLLGGAVQFWPVLEYTAWSPRAGGAGWEHAISFSMPPEELLNTYLPQFSGLLKQYAGRNRFHFHSEYIGAAVLPLVGLAFGAAGARRRQTWFWTGALVVSTLWALGGFTPFYSIVYALVPGTKYFRAPSTMLYVIGFCCAVLAGFGVDRALARGVSARYLAGWAGAGALLAVLATSGMLSNVAAAFAPQGFEALVDENRGALALGGWRALLATVAALGALFLAARGRVRPATAGVLLAGVVALDLWSVLRAYWGFSPPAAVIYAADPTIRYLQTQSDSGRVLTLGIPDAPLAYHDPFLVGDALMGHRVRQTTGYHGNELGRYQQLQQGGGEGGAITNPNFWRLTNTRFVLTNLPEFPIPGSTRVAGPARNAAGTMSYLYRLPGDNPPAWVTPLSVKAPDDNVLATVLDPRFDIGRVALFDTAAAVPTQPVPAQLPAPLDLGVRVTSRAPGRIALALDRPAPANAALVVSENYYPGWTATVDGTAAPVGRADFTFLGVPLRAGARSVVLQFTSERYAQGRNVTLAVVALSTLLLAGGAVLDRRGRRSGHPAS